MENNKNNIDKYFRKLSEEQEPKPFKKMNAIWNKVEEKLDQKKKKRIIPIWQYFEIKSTLKYASMVAAVLLLITVGSRFINNHPYIETTESEEEKIVLVDNEKIQEEFDSLHNSDDVVAFELAMPEKKEIIGNSETITTKEGKILQEVVKYTPPVIVEKTVESEIVLDDTYSEKDSNSLEEITIIGYSQRTKIAYTGSALKIEKSDKHGNSSTSSLRGEASGVNLFKESGAPGSDATIRIRGRGSVNQNTSPLYIIDGKPISQTDLNNIHPDDIGEITVLKDTSATAIYGDRGVNGVILIQTKQDLEKNGKRNVGKNIKIEDIHKVLPPIEIDTESYENFTE